MAGIQMVSMELSDDSKLDAVMPIAMDSKPDYPYGLNLCLTNDELEKLGVDPADAEVGGTFMLQGLARITSVSCNKTDQGDCWRIEATIEDLGVLGLEDTDTDGTD